MLIAQYQSILVLCVTVCFNKYYKIDNCLFCYFSTRILHVSSKILSVLFDESSISGQVNLLFVFFFNFFSDLS